MPILETSSHQHHHPPTSYTNNRHSYTHHGVVDIPDPTGKMQLTLILPNGVPSTLNVDANTPMMDLLIQAASNHKLNPSGYSLVVLDSNNHVIQFKPSQTVAQIGTSTISLLPKEREVSKDSKTTSKKNQPFEITVRLQVNLPDQQKILLRVDPTLPLYELKEQICKQKHYSDTTKYTLRLPSKLQEPLLLGLSLAEYKTNELTLVHIKHDERTGNGGENQLQSFDRLYRTRSGSQPRNETQNINPDDAVHTTTVKERDVSGVVSRTLSTPINTVQQSSTSTVPMRSSHPVTSHTTLHAYWNDPNFDAQSQSSTTSSTTKKRRAPRAPGSSVPSPQLQQHSYNNNQQMIYVQPSPVGVPVYQPQYVYQHHYVQEQVSPEQRYILAHRSQESLDDNNNLTDTSEQNDGTQRPSSATQHRLASPPENGTTIATQTGLPPPASSVNNMESSTVDNISLSEEFRSTIEIGQQAFDEDEKLKKTKVPDHQKQKIELTIVDGAKLLNFLTQQQSGTPLTTAETRLIMTDASTLDREQLYSKVQKTQQQNESTYSMVNVQDALMSPRKEEEPEKNTKPIGDALSPVTTTETLESTNYTAVDCIQPTAQNVNQAVTDVHAIADNQQSPPAITSSLQQQQQSVSPSILQKQQSSVIPQQQQQKRGKEVKSPKASKKSQTVDGLVKIMNDHHKRADEYRALPETQSLLKEKISPPPPANTLSSLNEENGGDEKFYFRVAKSRHGRFETDNRGFVNPSVAVIDPAPGQQQATIDNNKVHDYANRTQLPRDIHHQQNHPPAHYSAIESQQQPIQQRPPTKGKAAYEILKKYEKEDQEEQQKQEPIDTEYLKTKIDRTSPPVLTTADKTIIAEKDKSPTPIQLEVTERTTHIKVTVESDRKQLITRASPGPIGPPPLAPKPFGKTITEYRTVRRIGNGSGQQSTNQCTEISTTVQTKNSNTPESGTSTNSSQETLMDSIRKFGGSQNLGKKSQTK
ncbi:unnamed protein product [Didymodactylos carnosus]|uniref:Cordon-bleu ubiquitin-like domain-containing protein n=1 Tax=Didymodactylos carnosus TaxID=1234261 RepID=A0A814E4L1_9BILA|nr:unnamed protein product [Didymodactylos carnosus]CAF0964954.1 unnamed protein product [Didymodactylos carnosus]CAF3736871.1 unnamed protein product [Didymodactylos carnosus]CAF3736937.1 unnamed protein product [Didymodactylos carnosus]